MIRRLTWLVPVCLVLAIGAARASTPSAYQCSPGTLKKGVGCTCPAGFVEKRDVENTAVCVRRVVMVVDKPPTPPSDDPSKFDAIDTTLVASTATCTTTADCMRLAYRLDQGNGVAVDKAQAASLFEKACAANHINACYELGQRYEYGLGVEIDKAKADPLQARACELGNGRACEGVGAKLLTDGDKSKPFYARAYQLYLAGCNKGNVEACTGLAGLYENGGPVAENPTKSFQLYQQACQAGWSEACMRVAKAYDFGNGVAVDKAKAIRAYELACNMGEFHSCGLVGSLMSDPLLAGLAFAAGCRHGSFYGCWQLAKWYAKADSTTLARIKWKSPMTARERDARMIQAYELSCRFSAYNTACTELATRYLSGAGVAENKGRARTLLERACLGGENSCGSAATMYEKGEGGAADRAKAAALYALGCSRYEKHICKDRDRLRSQP